MAEKGLDLPERNGTGTGTLSTSYVKRDTGVAILAAGTTISFASAFISANYTIEARCYDAAGNNVDFTVTNKLAGGFDITPAINCSLDYVCILI